MAYVRYEWRELTEQGLLVKIAPVLQYNDLNGYSSADETLSDSFFTEEEAVEALFDVYGKQHAYAGQVPDNLTLIKLIDA